MEQRSEPAYRAHSRARDAREAVTEFSRGLRDCDPAVVVVFADPDYEHDELAAALGEAFAGVTVIGCTTAGEIGPSGYVDASLSGFALDKSAFDVVVRRVDDLPAFKVSSGVACAQELLAELQAAKGDDFRRESCFALLLVDGLSLREELVTSALHAGLGEIPLVGGSAGDAQSFRSTWVLEGGRFHANSAVVALVSTDLPFHVFETHHFTRGEETLVVTEADAEARVVRELNGLPAAEEYARALGTSVDALDAETLSKHPVVVRIGGEDHVRSIYQVGEDGSLGFFCAIDEGVVLRVAERGDMVADLEELGSEVRARIGDPVLSFLCDCILRQLEARTSGLIGDVERHMLALNAVGFSTYGEQLNSVHVNQTLTGIAIGSGRAAA